MRTVRRGLTPLLLTSCVALLTQCGGSQPAKTPPPISPSGTGGAGGSGPPPSPQPNPGTGGGGTTEPPVTPPAAADASAGPPPSGQPAPDAAPAPAPACGMPGLICCPGNTCQAGSPLLTPASGETGTTVLELVASGGDPYALFKDKDLLPIDGPDSGYITDTGTSFQFVLHENGAEETVSSGAHRQRNELTVNPGNPVMYKGLDGQVMSYTWRFRLDKMNANPTWCDIFQIKQHGPLGVAPLLQFRADKNNLNVETRLDTMTSVPLSAILGNWMVATLTVKYGHSGSVALLVKKEADGSEVIKFNGNADMWDTNVDFVRPKWGLYRNKAAGAGDATIQYNNMKIIRGSLGTPAGCACRN